MNEDSCLKKWQALIVEGIDRESSPDGRPHRGNDKGPGNVTIYFAS